MVKKAAANAIAVLLLPCSMAAYACTIPFGSSVANDPRWSIERSTAIFAGRATSVESNDDAVTARLEIDTVYKGLAPRVLVLRALQRDHPCYEATPPGSEPFFAFVRFDSGNIQAPDWIGFVRQTAVPTDFASRLGTPGPPTAGSAPLLKRLAPSGVPAADVLRTEGEVATETWRVTFERDAWHWDGKPRFYLRYPTATFLLDTDYVLEKTASWPVELREALRSSLPLREFTDLYKYILDPHRRPMLSEELDRLAIGATIDRRTQILIRDRCCLRVVFITRNSLGLQHVSFGKKEELVSSRWEPES